MKKNKTNKKQQEQCSECYNEFRMYIFCIDALSELSEFDLSNHVTSLLSRKFREDKLRKLCKLFNEDLINEGLELKFSSEPNYSTGVVQHVWEVNPVKTFVDND